MDRIVPPTTDTQEEARAESPSALCPNCGHDGLPGAHVVKDRLHDAYYICDQGHLFAVRWAEVS